MPEFTSLQNLDHETKTILGIVAGGLALILLIVVIALVTGDDEGTGDSPDAPAYLDEEGVPSDEDLAPADPSQAFDQGYQYAYVLQTHSNPVWACESQANLQYPDDSSSMSLFLQGCLARVNGE